MSLIEHQILSDRTEYGQWLIEEDEAWFLDRLMLYPEEEQRLLDLKGQRKLEWLAARWLLHLMSGRVERAPCLKDEYGKPYLKGSKYYISMSHSGHRVAIIASPYLVGIDIQKIVPRIGRIAKKFMAPGELETLKGDEDIRRMHIYWGGKECLYKAYGRRELDFCQNLRLQPFTFTDGVGKTVGVVTKAEEFWQSDIFFQIKDNYVLVYSIRKGH